MYKNFFHLSRNPFEASPDPRFLSMLEGTREALAGIEYGVSAHKGVMVLTGEVGTGKTTLLRRALESFGTKNVHFSYVFNPRFEVLDFLEFILFDFGLTPISRTKSSMLLQLNQWLIECYRRGETCVIVVDEAQNCSLELLEEIRLLTNLETAEQKLVQLILAGQPELETRLREPELRQLRQRIVIWCRTWPLTAEETALYVRDRLKFAGAEEPIFLPEAIERVHTLSWGIPRIVNLICEHSLILAYVRDVRIISAALVNATAEDLVLEPAPPVDLRRATSEAARGTEGPSQT
jgi:general secretion pathway protein A